VTEQIEPTPQQRAFAKETRLLLKTKLFIPPVRTAIMARPHLYTRLQQILCSQLTLISAPAGFGKTILLSSWCATRVDRDYHRHSHTPVAWLSLDTNDNDPTTFWHYVIAALQPFQPGISNDIIDLLFAPQPPPISLILTMLINSIDTSKFETIFILDDYHVIETEEIHRGLSFLLDHLPPGLHLVLSSRTVPSLPLARLRAQGQLQEFSMADLRFTVEETTTFFNTLTDLSLSQKSITSLDERIEGWAVGLRLAALALRGHENSAAFIETVTGKHRHILDYLVGEVLHQQPESVQRFLLFTSILERLHADLCDELMEHPGGQRMLLTLERANLFIVPLDEQREWYRYHQLFAAALHAHLQQSDPAQARRLHHRACEWYARQGFTVEALRHAMAASNMERIADLIEQEVYTVASIWTVSRLEQFSVYLPALSKELVHSRPNLCLLYTWHLLLRLASGVSIEIERIASLLHAAEQLLRDQGANPIASGALATLTAVFAYIQGDLDTTTQQALSALERLPHRHILRTGAANILFNAYKARGNTAAAEQAIEELAATSLETHDIHGLLGALFNLGQLQTLQGQLHQAAITYRRAIALKEHTFPQGFPEMSAVGLSEILLEWNEVAAAAHSLLPEVELTRKYRDTQFVLSCYSVLPRLEMARGNFSAALTAFEEYCGVIRQYQVMNQGALKDSLYHLLEAQRADLFLESGDLAMATHWATTYTPPGNELLNQYHLHTLTILARIRLANHAPAEALALLERPLRTAEQARYILLLIPMLLLQALAFESKGDQDDARDILVRALLLAEPGGFVRAFLREGPQMHHLLEEVRTMPDQGMAHAVSPIYIAQLMSAFDAQIGPEAKEQTRLHNARETLSAREQEVLHYMAEGLSDREIAQTLFLAESTIKTYARRIYGKLDAKNRTQAVTRARVLRFL
jgi:LuxR family maltose regulon positive regulatory protein